MVSCSLTRSPIIERSDAGGLDTPAVPLDTPNRDAPIELDTPPPIDAPDPCMSCPTGTRCMSTATCECDPALCDGLGECAPGGGCSPCGHLGERCCASDECRVGGRCMGGSCVEAGGPCGDRGQPCCDGLNCNLGGDECIGGTCSEGGGSCGGSGEDCCPGDGCVSGTSCQGVVFRNCRACGGDGQACCPFGPNCDNGGLTCYDLAIGRICSSL